MKIRVCDLCMKQLPNLTLKYKYKAKRHWSRPYEDGWEKVELCNDCLAKIIKVDRKLKEEPRIN